MTRYFAFLLLSIYGFLHTNLHAQAQFKLVPVDKVETTYNTVTSTVHAIGEGQYLYTAGDGDKIEAYQLGEAGQMRLLDTYKISREQPTVRGLIADTAHGQDFLFAGLKGANAIEVYQIKADGSLNSVFVLEDTDSTYLGIVITLQVIHLPSGPCLYVGGLERKPGLSAFRITPEGKLLHIQSMADTEALHTDGVIGMSVHQINGKTFLFTGGFHDNGLSSFQVHDDGHFENISNIHDDNHLYLNGAYPVISATKSDWRYVIVGHRHHIYYKPTPWIKDRHRYFYHGDAVSVFVVDEMGQLLPRALLQGNSETLIKGQTRLQRLPWNAEYDLIALGTRDDQSIQLCLLNQTGRLIAAGNIKTGFPIYYGLAGQKIGESLFLYAGSVTGKELVSYRVDLIDPAE